MTVIQEGKTFIYEGKQRQGKTLAMSLAALGDYEKGRNIVSNVPFTFPFTPIKFKDLQLSQEEGTIHGSTICLDELNFLFDGRSSGTGINKKFSYFLLQTKKMGVNLLGTTHDLGALDKRFRMNYDYLIVPECLPINRKDDSPPEALILEIFNGPNQRNFHRKKVINLKDRLGLYDTTHTFNPFAD